MTPTPDPNAPFTPDPEKLEAEGGDLARTQFTLPTTEVELTTRLNAVVDPAVLAELEPNQRAYVGALAVNGVVGWACVAAGVPRSLVTYWRKQAKNKAAFVKAEDGAKEHAAELLESEAHRRAVVGTVEPVYGRVAKDQDGVVGYKRTHSDRLLTVLLQGNLPTKFKNRTELTGPDGGPIQVAPVIDRIKDRLAAQRARMAEPAPAEGEATKEEAK